MKTVDEYVDLAEEALETASIAAAYPAGETHARRAQVFLGLANLARLHQPSATPSGDLHVTGASAVTMGTAQFPGITGLRGL